MKPMDILEALSDLPEDYAAFAVQNAESRRECGSEQSAKTTQGGIVMRKHTAEKQSDIKVGKVSFAAAVAACIGLNAAIIYGVSHMQKDSGVLTSQQDVASQIAVESVQEQEESAAESPAVTTAAKQNAKAPAAQTEAQTETTNTTAAQTQKHEETVTSSAQEQEHTQNTAEPEQPETAPQEQIITESIRYQPGDVDMDGNITYADAILVFKCYSYMLWDRQDEIPLTAEQLALANVSDVFENEGTLLMPNSNLNADGSYGDNYRVMHAEDYPITDDDVAVIFWTAVIRRHYGLPELTTADYTANRAYYEELTNTAASWFISDMDSLDEKGNLGIWLTRLKTLRTMNVGNHGQRPDQKEIWEIALICDSEPETQMAAGLFGMRLNPEIEQSWGWVYTWDHFGTWDEILTDAENVRNWLAQE